MKKILVTTTESLYGWEIESYLKPVFSNVVIGAGFLSDFSASFTDMFGGRSNSYERKLQSVNDSALQILQSKASELGANCIIGLKVNVHQISGKNIQMFMVSAYGTAVVAKSITTAKVTTSSKEIDKTTVADKAKLIELLNSFEKDDFKLTMEDLQLIVDNKSSEFKSFIYSKLKKRALNNYGVEDDPLQNQIEKLYFEYFSVIDQAEATKVLYDALLNESDEKIRKKVLAIIKGYDLVDYNYCTKLLGSESIASKKLALEILTYDKPYYVSEDVNDLTNIITILESSFPVVATLSTKKGFLSSNEKEVWVCTCGKANSITDIHCNSCDKDQFSFRSDELTPNETIKNLNNVVLALKDVFTNGGI
ncbi:MAG: hypothetical protein JWR02_1632 [Mucilaginibacter sp.]|nr:hypothetical protein [Mucilaginibacter sp.]